MKHNCKTKIKQKKRVCFIWQQRDSIPGLHGERQETKPPGWASIVKVLALLGTRGDAAELTEFFWTTSSVSVSEERRWIGRAHV